MSLADIDCGQNFFHTGSSLNCNTLYSLAWYFILYEISESVTIVVILTAAGYLVLPSLATGTLSQWQAQR